MTRGWLLVPVLFCLQAMSAAVQGASPAAVDIGRETQRVPVWQALRIVNPGDRQLAPYQAAQLAAGFDAMMVDGPERVLGRGDSPYWALFSLRNPAPSEEMRVLALEATTQFDTDLFERDDAGVWRPLQSIASTAAGRIGGGTINPAWALHLAPHRATDLLLRIEGPAIVRFPVYVYDPLSFAERERRTHILIGAALGGCIFVMAFIGWPRRYLDDRSVPLLLCMLVSNLVGALWVTGVLSELFPAVPEPILSAVGVAAYAVLFGCGSLHARIYLNSIAWAPTVDRWLRALGWLWLALAPWFSLVSPFAARTAIIWGGTAMALTLIAVSIGAARAGVSFSRYILAAWLAYAMIGSYFLVARLFDNPALWSPNTNALVQATLVAVLFGLATNQRMMQQRDALSFARREAVMQREKSAALLRQRSLLFAATNHDLRQPLLGVGMFAQLLKSARTSAEREAHARKLDMALKEVDELLVNIQQLVAVHEVSHHPHFETVRLDDLLRPIVEEYRGRSEHKRVSIRYVASRLSITTHAPYFQRIVRNALSNAVRYSTRGDRILIGCRRGGGLRLIIKDTGRGMSEAQIRRAFEAFQRFDPDTSIPDGYGLGLFSTKTLADALGLAVSLHGDEGRGTEFRILFPARGVRKP